ncbi:MAG: response regulator transcription factor [Deltaproteobacteria bacterium]|nr:response regulator transcription factor [Deltaproteobacteria bacterium]
MKILLVEEELELAESLARDLGEAGHDVDVVGDSHDAFDHGVALGLDLIVVDWVQPGRDGLTLLDELRAHGVRTPVLMLNARDTPEERVLALRTGADDHLGKPFEWDELLARVEALHRRASRPVDIVLGDVLLDERRRVVICAEREVAFTSREWSLLMELARHGGEVVERSQLRDAVWGSDTEAASNVVDVYVGYLRQKLAAVGTRRVRILAVRGVGYQLTLLTDD